MFVGTDNGLYTSLNLGNSWELFSNNFPNVAVHDLVIQPKAKELIVATHGRSLYKANIAPLQKMTKSVLSTSTHVFAMAAVRKNSSWGRSWSPWRKASTPEIKIPFYSKTDTKVAIGIYLGDLKVNAISIAANSGFNEAIFDVSFSEKGKKAFEKANKKSDLKAAKNGVFYLVKGKYTVKTSFSESEFEIK